jgi:hypothetical protein
MPITATFTRDSVLIMFALSCNDFAFTETRLIVTAIHSRNEVTSQRCHRRRSEIASMSRNQNVAAVVFPHMTLRHPCKANRRLHSRERLNSVSTAASKKLL